MPRVQNLVHGHAPGPGVQRRVQRNGMAALGTRPLLSLAPYGTDVRCTHHAHGRPPLQRFVSVTPKAVGAPSTIGCPVDSSMPRFEASQSAIPCPHETPQQTLYASLPYTRKRLIDICVASTWRFSSPYLHIAKPSSFTSAWEIMRPFLVLFAIIYTASRHPWKILISLFEACVCNGRVS